MTIEATIPHLKATASDDFGHSTDEHNVGRKRTEVSLTPTLPPSLLEAELAFNALEKYGFVPEYIKKYIEANERTKALEATAPGVVMQTYQAWDRENRELVGYGFSTAEIYKKGLADIKRLRGIHGNKIDFEEERRTIELLDAMVLNDAVGSGVLNTCLKVVISPYPMGADKETAKSLGYFAEKQTAMVRVFDFNPKDNLMEVSQVALEQTNIAALTEIVSLIERMVPEKLLSPSEILGKQLYIPKDELKNGVIDIAMIYDSILERDSNNRYFFGEILSEDETQDYQAVRPKTREMEAQIKPIIEHLVQTDIENAASLRSGKGTGFITELTWQALTATDENGNFLLDFGKRNKLVSSLSSRFDVTTAEIIKDFVTKSDYLALLCLTNPQLAQSVFTKEQLKTFRENYAKNPKGTIAERPNLTPTQQFMLYACGGSMAFGGSVQQAYAASIEDFNSFLRESGESDEKGPLNFKCTNGHPNKRPRGQTIPKCTTCGEVFGCR